MKRAKLLMYVIFSVYISAIRTVYRPGHDCRSANVIGIRNVNTILLNGEIVIFNSTSSTWTSCATMILFYICLSTIRQ